MTEEHEPGALIKQAVGKGEIEVDYGSHTEQREPGALIKQAVGKGEIEVDYGSHTEQRDLYFLNIGNENGSSHVAFWMQEGSFQHPNFIVIDVWEPDIPVQLMESVEPQPYLTGNCRG